MPQNRPRPPRIPGSLPPRDPRPGGDQRFSPIALISMGLGIYLVTLWFGIAVVGDTTERSALMAGVILGIAATGYLVSGRGRQPPRRKR